MGMEKHLGDLTVGQCHAGPFIMYQRTLGVREGKGYHGFSGFLISDDT